MGTLPAQAANKVLGLRTCFQSNGYTPDASAVSGYRRIHLTTKQKNLIVQTREGYYPS